MERKLHYDFIRIVACFLVILNHTIIIFNNYGKVHFTTWLTADFMFFTCKIAVPLFLMLSGALLLGKEESYRKIFIHKIIKTLVVLIIWSLIYKTFYKMYYNHSLLSFNEIILIIKGIKDKPVSTHLWYLYMLIGIYFMTPFVRKMVQGFKQKDYIIFMILWFIFATLIPFVNVFYPIKYSGDFQVQIFTGFIGYYVAGYYFDNLKIDKKVLLFSICMVAFGLILSTMYTLKLSIDLGKTSRVLDNVIIFPIALTSIFSFVILKKVGILIANKINDNRNIKNIIVNISSVTFGIYLIHILIIFILTNTNIVNIPFRGYEHSITKTIFLDFIVFVVSGFFIALLKKVPIVKNIV